MGAKEKCTLIKKRVGSKKYYLDTRTYAWEPKKIILLMFLVLKQINYNNKDLLVT
jgi:hypothetical protein